MHAVDPRKDQNSNMKACNVSCSRNKLNPLRPIAALAAIIDSTYSRRHKKCKKCTRKVKSSLFEKMTLPEKNHLFFGAPSPLKRIAWENFKGGCPPVKLGFEGAEPLVTFGILRLRDARKCILGHGIWSKLCCLLTWTPPGFCISHKG